MGDRGALSDKTPESVMGRRCLAAQTLSLGRGSGLGTPEVALGTGGQDSCNL